MCTGILTNIDSVLLVGQLLDPKPRVLSRPLPGLTLKPHLRNSQKAEPISNPYEAIFQKGLQTRNTPEVLHPKISPLPGSASVALMVFLVLVFFKAENRGLFWICPNIDILVVIEGPFLHQAQAQPPKRLKPILAELGGMPHVITW